jgi:hypothetical protein
MSGRAGSARKVLKFKDNMIRNEEIFIGIVIQIPQNS